MALKCPDCDITLKNKLWRNNKVWQCPHCQGKVVNMGIVKKNTNEEQFRQILQNPDSKTSSRPCPSCRKKMEGSPLTELGFQLDICRQCYLMFFDYAELQALTKNKSSHTGKNQTELDKKPTQIWNGEDLLRVYNIQNDPWNTETDFVLSGVGFLIGGMGIMEEMNYGGDIISRFITMIALGASIFFMSRYQRRRKKFYGDGDDS